MRLQSWGRIAFGIVLAKDLLLGCSDSPPGPIAARTETLLSDSLSTPPAGGELTTSDSLAAITAKEKLPGNALDGLTAEQQQAFLDGKEAFEEQEGLDDGLGPLFNEKSCAICHSVGATGGSGVQFEVRAGRSDNGTFDSLVLQGGQLFDLFSVNQLPGNERAAIPNCTLAKTGEPVPANANVRTVRRTTALFGLGLVDATPDSTFAAIAAAQPAAIRGRVNMVFNISAGTNTVGKFGWKSQVPTLFQFAADAYLNEMGITSPQFMSEQAPSGDPNLVAACDIVPEPEDNGDDVQAFTDFMQLLAPVEPLAQNADARAGDARFTQLGCASCHLRNLTSGSSPIAALDHTLYHPFSDFLLHDMGALGDGIGDNGIATVREMRTAPLWGIRVVFKQSLLHDGRAKSLEDAILRHDGQAAASRNSFATLGSAERAQVIAFLNTL
ncbi:MAG TPA: di-heme oxidoredictase family protein [Polyangiaceae bacterium]|nr:di-heme oxidoredictase family protein [Polyangiaceae bacterium]